MRSQKENHPVYEMPPSRICGVCRNRMNEVCVEECALCKDYKHFDPDFSRPFESIPKITIEEYRELNGRAKGEWMFYRLEKLIAFMGGEDGRDTHYPASRRLPKDFKEQGLLVGADEPDTVPADREECADTGKRP